MSIRCAAGKAPSTPLDAARTHRPATRSCSSAWPPWVLVRCSSTAAGESAPPSTVCASSSSEAASSRARAACTARRAARWTTLLTATATVTNSSRASSSRGCWMVNVWIGSVKYQLSRRLAATAASTAGQKPPITVVATTATRYTKTKSARFRCARPAARTTVSSGSRTAASSTPASRRRTPIAAP